MAQFARAADCAHAAFQSVRIETSVKSNLDVKEIIPGAAARATPEIDKNAGQFNATDPR